MRPTWPDSPEWTALAEPLRPVLEPAIAALPLRPAVLPPVVAARPGEQGLTARGIALDPSLLGPGPRGVDDEAWAEEHPELAALALDRWRRAAGLVLEGIALAAIDEEVGARLPRDWWTVGPAAEAVDQAAPVLGWLWPAAVGLLRRPEQGLHARPRRGAWLLRWFRRTGRAWTLGERPDLDDAAWAEFGHWLEDLAHGPAAACPVPLSRGPARDLQPFEAPPLSHHRVRVQAGPPGLVLRWSGGHRALALGEPGEQLVATRAGGLVDLALEPVLPLGTWVLTGGTVGERPGAARGIELTLLRDGSIDVVFADAFAGPPTPYLLGLAKTVGVSGTGRGHYRVVRADAPGQGALVFADLTPDLLTVHPRLGGKFALPSEAFLGPVHKALQAMTQVTWDFTVDDEGLRLQAHIFGQHTVLRLTRPT